jgi:mycofactocin precursor
VSQPITETTEVAPADQPSAVAETADARAADALVEQDLLVEDVSIDGRCGVY